MGVYATALDVEAWTGEEVPDADRKIRAAENLLAEILVFPLDDVTVFDADELEILKNAVCAQVEFWELVGSEHYIGGVHGDVGGVRAPGLLAKQARSILLGGNMLTQRARGYVTKAVVR